MMFLDAVSHPYTSISSVLDSLQKLLVCVAELKRECRITDTTFHMNTNIDFDDVPLLHN
jgi:hypothetical protein